MIVVSMLLILVAVTLLVLGLAGGSSALLISSIAASLLAAVFLVAGARRAAAVRRGARSRADATGLPPVDAGDVPVAEPAMAGSRRGSDAPAAEGFHGGTGPADPAGPPDEGWPADAWAAPGSSRAADPSAFADDPPASDEGLASPGPTHAKVANPDDAEAALAADAAYRAAGPDNRPGSRQAAASDRYDFDGDVPASADEYDEASYGAADDYPDDARSRAADAPDDPDYDRAASYIGGARSENPNENAWRREHSADDSAAVRVADGSGAEDEFAEPDEDDPADEPLPQAVRPADAVRVARMNAEVLVVDGRPRYHLPDCTHLVGRLTEPLPVAEAVELGFSPCGLCRPVDRLVGQAVHR